MKREFIIVCIAITTLVGCATTVKDYEEGVGWIGNRDVPLPDDGYEVFGLLRALFYTCRPISDDSFNSRESLWTYYYSSPPMWGFDYDEDRLVKSSEQLENLANAQLMVPVCGELIELSEKKVSYLGKPIDTKNGPNMMQVGAVNSSHNTTVMAHNMGHSSLASGMAAITLLQSAIAIYQAVDAENYVPTYGLPPIPSSLDLSSYHAKVDEN